MALDALIFDVDGTLAETEDAHRAAFNLTFAAAGLDWNWGEDLYRELLRVAGGKERIAHYANQRGITLPVSGERSIAVLHARKTEAYNASVRQGGLALRRGVAQLLYEARRSGLKLAIATTTSFENVRSLIEVTLGGTLADHFDVVAAGDMVAAKKPAPDVYLLALERLAVAPARAIAFEDSAIGLAASTAAGIATVVTPSPYTAHHDFTGALVRLSDLTTPLADGHRLDVAGLGRLLAAHDALTTSTRHVTATRAATPNRHPGAT